jgi:hypothetical protein
MNTEMIKIHSGLSGFTTERISEENEEFIRKHEGSVFRAVRHNMNYYRFDNGHLIHIYDTIVINS